MIEDAILEISQWQRTGTLWRTRDKRLLRLSEMQPSHILNAIAMIKRHWPHWRSEFLPLLEEELRRRIPDIVLPVTYEDAMKMIEGGKI